MRRVLLSMLRWRPRYSLRTLVLATLLATCVAALRHNWGPWVRGHGWQAHKQRMVSVGSSADGLRLVTASIWDSKVRVWDLRRGRIVCELDRPGLYVTSAEISSDGRRVRTRAMDGTVRIADADTGYHIVFLEPRRFFTRPVEFSSADPSLVACRWRGEADWVDGRAFREGYFGADRSGNVVVNCPGGSLRLGRGVIDDRDCGVWRIAVAADCRSAAVVYHDGYVRLWRRSRPEPWWGVFCLKEFWLSVAFAAAFVWSILADRRRFRTASPPA